MNINAASTLIGAEGTGSSSADSGSADTGNGIEVRALLLQKSNGKYFWAVVVDRGGDDAPDIIGPYANSADAKDAAWLTAQRLGGTMVYPAKVRRR